MWEKKPLLVALPVFFALFITPPLRAQNLETPTQLQVILDLHAASSRLDELTDVAERMSYSESVALLIYHGAWAWEKDNWPYPKSPFFYDVLKSAERLPPTVKEIERFLQRAKSLEEGEERDFRAIVDEVKAMLDEAQAFYYLLHNGDWNAASAFYQHRTRDRYLSIQNDAYTLSLTLENRIRKVGVEVRSLK